ncbi:MAG: hypothetical protein RI993_954, partial [Pseudomonadota bacterium]
YCTIAYENSKESKHQLIKQAIYHNQFSRYLV